MKNNKLKPCPFCGSTEVAFLDGGVYDEMRFQVECQNCGATVGFINESRSDDELGEAWNMRSTTEIKSKTMTLDEAIEYCEEVATKNCLEYVEEHQQLANWLHTLKYLKENAVMPIHKKQDWLGIANYYGKKQIPLVIEEMAELTQALTKYMRITQFGQPVRKTIDEVQDSIKEELSDVIVMLIQLQHLFNIDNATINKIADEKLKRTLKLMEEQECQRSNLKN